MTIEKDVTFWAIGDLHLSIGLEKEKQKPMDQFGEHWVQHTVKIARAWCEQVQPNDVVLLLGDLFWGNRLEEAVFALNWLGALPGRKVLVRGNHDNWWQSIANVRATLPEGMYAIQNDSLVLDGVAIAGARGWSLMDSEGQAHSEKMFRRECLRLKASLETIPEEAETRICMMHFPPFLDNHIIPAIETMLQEAKIDVCVFGHLHGVEAERFNPSEKNCIKYVLASADNIDFRPVKIYNKQYNRDKIRNN